MNTQEKKYTATRILVGTSLLLAVAVWFYWSEYKLQQIARDCSDGLLGWSVRSENTDLYSKFYKQCINSGGYENFRSIVNENRQEDEPDEETNPAARPALIVPTSNGN